MLPGDTASDSTFTTIEEWLHTCTNNHDRCGRIGIKRASANLHEIRFLCIYENHVVLTDGVIPDRYACLSHCWGSGENVSKTTRTNIQEHQGEGIILSKLPKTFQDTIHVCQKLKLSYVWIDSLCIIQDDPVDWDTQAHRMADVYQNAFVTIAASKANDPVEGLFSSTHWSCQGEILPGFTDVHVRKLPPPIIDDDHELDFRYDLVDQTNVWPLVLRGWVYQELWLSTRVIHYGAHEVSWHCHTTVERESTTVIYPHKLEKRRTFRAGDAKSLRSQWYKAVEAYAWRYFTFPKDRLPAFAAIAQKMQELRPDDEYMAGLWRHTLLFDLMWSFVHDDEQRQLDTTHSFAPIPTWSWMRIHGAIKWTTKPHDTCLKNVELLSAAYVRHKPTIPNCDIDSHITLRAPLIDISTLHSRKEAKKARRSVISENWKSPNGDASELIYLKHNWDLPNEVTHASKENNSASEDDSSVSSQWDSSDSEVSSNEGGVGSDGGEKGSNKSEERSSVGTGVLTASQDTSSQQKLTFRAGGESFSKGEQIKSKETFGARKERTVYAIPLTTAHTWIGSYPFTAILVQEVDIPVPSSDMVPIFPGARRFKRVGLTELWCASRFPTKHRPDGFDYDAEGEAEHEETLRYIEGLEADLVTLI